RFSRDWSSDVCSSDLRATATIAVAALIYEAAARSGIFPSALLPTLPAVARALAAGIADGTILGHAAATLYRVMVGLTLAVGIGRSEERRVGKEGVGGG